MVENLTKINNWLLSSTFYAYLLYLVSLIFGGAIGAKTPLGIIISLIFINGYALALGTLICIFVILWLYKFTKKITRRWRDEITEQIANKILDNAKK